MMNDKQYTKFNNLRNIIGQNLQNQYYKFSSTEVHTAEGYDAYHVEFRGPYNFTVEYCSTDEDLCRYVCFLLFALLFPDFTFTEHRKRRSRKYYLKCLIDVLEVTPDTRDRLLARVNNGEPVDFILQRIGESIDERVEKWNADPKFRPPRTDK